MDCLFLHGKYLSIIVEVGLVQGRRSTSWPKYQVTLNPPPHALFSLKLFLDPFLPSLQELEPGRIGNSSADKMIVLKETSHSEQLTVEKNQSYGQSISS